MTKRLTGLVLAGGKSSRLGRDKTQERFSGMRMLERTCHLLRDVCGQVWVSGRDPSDHGLDFPWIPDEVAGTGPMGGILTCLEQLGTPLLVLACDMPLMDLETLDLLAEAHAIGPESTVMTTFRQEETGFIESLAAIYEPSAAPLLRQAVRGGQYKLSRAIPEVLRHHIPYSQDQAQAFFNINYPADLALLRQVERLSKLTADYAR